MAPRKKPARAKGRAGGKRPPADAPADPMYGLFPSEYRGTDRYLDVVTWNIRWFHDRDEQRVMNVARVLTELNADIIVMQEIKEHSLGKIIDILDREGVGHYEAVYGTTGGDQRVALMYDLDWVRAKDTPRELVGQGEVVSRHGRDAFPRLPLWGYFTGLTKGDPFDFQLVGLHLKSQVGDGVVDKGQRVRAAEWLADWLTGEGSRTDPDIILTGDWNEPPTSDTWDPIRAIEDGKKAVFTKINDKDSISHLMYRNRDNLGSRLDLNVVSTDAAENMKGDPRVITWKPLTKLLRSNAAAGALKALIKDIKRNVSDHKPVVTRYHFSEKRRP